MCDRELTLADLLADPMVLAMMAADRVDPAALAAELRALAQRLWSADRAQIRTARADQPW